MCLFCKLPVWTWQNITLAYTPMCFSSLLPLSSLIYISWLAWCALCSSCACCLPCLPVWPFPHCSFSLPSPSCLITYKSSTSLFSSWHLLLLLSLTALQTCCFGTGRKEAGGRATHLYHITSDPLRSRAGGVPPSIQLPGGEATPTWCVFVVLMEDGDTSPLWRDRRNLLLFPWIGKLEEGRLPNCIFALPFLFHGTCLPILVGRRVDLYDIEPWQHAKAYTFRHGLWKNIAMPCCNTHLAAGAAGACVCGDQGVRTPAHHVCFSFPSTFGTARLI